MMDITWTDVSEYIGMIVKKYKDTNLTGVYGIPRGGVILAVMISHALDIPLLFAPTADCLIIDDICDSGESLIHYSKNTSALRKPKYHISTMMYKDGAIVTPELYWGIKGNDWVIFPWEGEVCIK